MNPQNRAHFKTLQKKRDDAISALSKIPGCGYESMVMTFENEISKIDREIENFIDEVAIAAQCHSRSLEF